MSSICKFLQNMNITPNENNIINDNKNQTFVYKDFLNGLPFEKAMAVAIY